MSLGVKYRYGLFNVGTVGFFTEFFATVCMRLENGVWGSRFPVVMRQLYWGRVEVASLQEGIAELEVIKREFLERPVSDALWVTGVGNDRVEPDYIVTRGEHAHNLFEYFTTIDNGLLLDRLIGVFTEAMRWKDEGVT
ncbi:Imm70 family immunity protein, partial [Galliscardovia ingluviei]|uniref:Imm70 family immunity protein n=1 Tax=Galliscardovia ingluviei TaxID=1769422 RepID=UPI00166C12DA